LPFEVSSFSKSGCLDFIANDEWPPIHVTLIHWITRFGSNAGVLSQAATKAKNSSRVLKCILVNLVCLTGESNWQRCERQLQTTASMCVSHRNM